MPKKPGKGHNASEVVEVHKLKPLFNRLVNLAEQRASIREDEKAVYAEAKANGFDTKHLRKCVADHFKDAEKIREFEEVHKLYRAAVGILADTPLGRASVPEGHA